MSIQDELKAELVAAIRERDKPRSNVIRQIETEVSVVKAAPGFTGEVDDALYKKTIAAYVKKMNKARQEFEAAGDRGVEQAAKLAYEVDYLQRWLPRTLDDDATRALVKAAIAELDAHDPKMAGRVTGHVMKSGQALDGGLVSRIVGEELGS